MISQIPIDLILSKNDPEVLITPFSILFETSLTTSAVFTEGSKIDLSQTAWSQNTGKTLFPKSTSYISTKLYSDKNNTSSVLSLQITENGEVYMAHSGSLITDGNDYWHGSLVYPIAD